MNKQNRHRHKTQGRPSLGFTLVELLVVITIIAILAALATIGVRSVMFSVKQTRIKFELDQIDAAVKEFKLRYGAYPPCDLRVTSIDPANVGYNLRLRTFLSKAFPRYAHNAPGSSGSMDRLMDDLKAADGGADRLRTQFHPDRALAFWLSGMHADVSNPFLQGTSSSRTPLIALDKTRLLVASTLLTTGTPAIDTTPTGDLVYVPSGGEGVPYVYFDWRSYGTLAVSPYTDVAAPPTIANAWEFTSRGGVKSSAVAYVQDVNGDGVVTVGTDTWANPDSFQILSAGQDGMFGVSGIPPNAKQYPTGKGYAVVSDNNGTADNDNISNFSEKSSLEDAIP